MSKKSLSRRDFLSKLGKGAAVTAVTVGAVALSGGLGAKQTVGTKPVGGYKISVRECIACGACQPECPCDCIDQDSNAANQPAYYIDPECCIGCGACAELCPVEAIFQE